MNVLYTAEALATGGRDGRARSSDGKLDVALKPPVELGGPDVEATNPEQLFAAGYGACYLSALSLTARMQKISAREFSVRSHVQLVQDEDNRFGLAVQLRCELPGVERDRAMQLIRSAHQTCPYSRATRGNIPVSLFLGDEAVD